MLIPLLHHDIAYSKAVLVGAWIEGPLYGLNIALYIFCARMLLSGKSSLRRNALLAVATFQLMMSTGHFASTLPYLFQGFVKYVAAPGGPDAYFADPASPVGSAQYIFYFTNYVTSDAIMAWRCYTVWNRSWRIAVPFALVVIGSIICGYSGIAHIEELAQTQDIFAVVRWSTAMFALSLGTQICASALIVWKIWWNAPKNLPSSRKQYVFVMWMIVESGAILAAATATDLTLFRLSMNAGAILSNIITQLACIVPTSIIVRAGLKRRAAELSTLPVHEYNSKSGVMVNTTRRTDAESFPGSAASNSTFVVNTFGETKSIDSTESPAVQHQV